MTNNHKLKIRYNGGDATENRIELYDGSTSIQGFAQALHIATHAFVNGSTIHKAPALKGAQVYLNPAKSGSFLVDISIAISKDPAVALSAGGIFAAYTAAPFYDFIKMIFGKAVGNADEEPETPAVRKALEKHEPFFDEVAEIMEGSLQRAHRPIGEGVGYVTVERARSSLLQLDENTKDWVNTNNIVPPNGSLCGNVTRYNSITRNGRMYVDEFNRVVPFRIGEDFQLSTLGLLTWSLHGSNSGLGGTIELPKKLNLDAAQVQSSTGRVKRIILSDCSRAGED